MSSFASTSEASDFVHVLRGFTAGGAAAIMSKTVTAPVDRVKLLLQLQNRSTMAGTSEMSRQYNGMLDCFKRLCAEQGVKSLWRGNSANVMRCLPSNTLNFVLRDQYRLLFLHNVDKKKQYGRFVLGNFFTSNTVLISHFR
jgi:solute carrier family 25 (adenine nucleotide translocator) protein 4/5/6/31